MLIENETRSTWNKQEHDHVSHIIHTIGPHVRISRLTGILFHSPEVQRTVQWGGKPFYTLRSGWDKTKEKKLPHSPQL